MELRLGRSLFSFSFFLFGGGGCSLGFVVVAAASLKSEFCLLVKHPALPFQCVSTQQLQLGPRF